MSLFHSSLVAKRRRIGCGPVQLASSRSVRARNILLAIVRTTPLSLREFADVFGVEYMTIVNHLKPGKQMARSRQRWYHRLESVDVQADVVTITLRYHPTRKRGNFMRDRTRKTTTPP